MGCAVGTVKFTVFVFNFLLVCLGFAMVLIGALDSPLPEELDNFNDIVKEVSLTSKVLIVTGSIIFIIAFFGCWGAVSDSPCMLFGYSMFLMLLIIVEVSVGLYVYVHRDTAEESARDALKKWMKDYTTVDSNKVIIDKIQKKLQCCGVDGPNDWKSVGSGTIPTSCCPGNYTPSDSISCPNPNPEGCLKKGVQVVVGKLQKYTWILGAIVGVQLLTILFALVVRNSILNENRRNFA